MLMLINTENLNKIFSDNKFLERTFTLAELAHYRQKYPGTDKDYSFHLMLTLVILYDSCNKAPIKDQYVYNNLLASGLCHDILEDTPITYEQLEYFTNKDVARVVSACTKDDTINKEDQLVESLYRISRLEPIYQNVKVADRLANLSQMPPKFWKKDKVVSYINDTYTIMNYLDNDTDQYRYLYDYMQKYLKLWEKDVDW